MVSVKIMWLILASYLSHRMYLTLFLLKTMWLKLDNYLQWKNNKKMKNLPIGIQTFAKIRDKKENYIYIDK